MPACGRSKSAENAGTSADDAFGNSVGLESTSIYSENNARGLTPYEYICKCWTNEPERFSLNPHH